MNPTTETGDGRVGQSSGALLLRLIAEESHIARRGNNWRQVGDVVLYGSDQILHHETSAAFNLASGYFFFSFGHPVAQDAPRPGQYSGEPYELVVFNAGAISGRGYIAGENYLYNPRTRTLQKIATDQDGSQTVRFGRSHEGNDVVFPEGNTISRHHGSLAITPDGQMHLTDSSTYGTVVGARWFTLSEGMRETIREKVEREALSYGERDFQDFLKFWAKHEDDIFSLTGYMDDLFSFVYSYFCIRHNNEYIPDVRYYNMQEPAAIMKVNRFNPKQVRIDLSGETKNPEKKFLQAYIGRGLKSTEPKGRIYLPNVYGKLPEQFIRIIRAALEQDIPMHVKIPASGLSQNLARVDPFVVYFNEKDSERVMKVLQGIYAGGPGNVQGPAFARPIREIPGAYFGQEAETGTDSFSQTRARILTSLISESPQGADESDKRALFRKICERYHVDPDDPAFNMQLAGRKKQFPLFH